MFLFGLFCAFKTLTIDFVHFYDIIAAKNVRTRIPLKGVLVAFRDADKKFCRLLLKCFSKNMGKNKLIRSVFILIGHRKSILIAIRNFKSRFCLHYEISKSFNRCFWTSKTQKWNLWTLGLLAYSSVSRLYDFLVSVVKI